MSELALKLIKENKELYKTDPEKAKFLDLGRCGLIGLPKELFECLWIEELNLGNDYFTNFLKISVESRNSGNTNLIKDVNLKGLQCLPRLKKLYLSDCNVESIDFIENLTELEVLDLRGNLIQDIHQLNILTNLKQLFLSSNPIKDYSVLKNLDSLIVLFITNTKDEIYSNDYDNDYGNGYELKNINFIANMVNLEALALWENVIDDIEPIRNLTKIKFLHLSGNKINNIDFLQGLYELNYLSLRNNDISDINSLEKLTNLNSLNLSSNQISHIRFLEKLTNLKSLDLSFNKISDIRFLEKLTNLNSLFLSSNQISDIRFLEKLTNLKSLYLSLNEINDYSFLENLTNLNALDLSNNQINDILFLEKLTNLNSLFLSSNQISDIRFLEKLTNLNSLDLSSNQISDIKPLLPLLKKGVEIGLEEFDFQGKINLKENQITNPPIEIVKQGREAVIRYFEKLEKEGKDYIYEAKLTLVGDGGVGKTSLQTRIINKNAPLPKSEERTRGIKVSEWPFTDSNNNTYRVNIWDFGGQDVYFPVHRFFLTDNSVYILMATTRIQSHNFEYWIPTIYQFGGSSPIILTQTCHDSNKAHWNELSIFYSNPNFKLIKPHYELNLPNNNEGLERLEKAIEHQIVALPHIGEAVPASWKIVREKLSDEKKTANCISYERFATLCKGVDKENFNTEKDIELIGRFFADLGIILWYYNKEYLKDWVILQPQWAMNAVYKIIDDGKVQECGIIHKSDFDKLWSEEEYVRRKDLLKKMLQEFKIAFPKKNNTNDYLLPIRLKSLPKEKQWTNIDKAIRLQYDFDFMPRGIVNQISAELSRYILSDTDVWNNAVNLSYNGSEAQIEEDFFNRKIYVKANGQEARSLVVLIMDAIENTLQGYKGVKATIQVPCSCEICKSITEPTLFPYSKLLEWMRKNSNVRCNESGTDITIKSLLYEVGFDKIAFSAGEFIDSELRKGTSKKIELKLMKKNEEIPEIFFSYAWDKAGETESREKIVNELYQSLLEENFKVIIDKADLPYRESISEFMQRIGKGDIIVVAISDAYIKSPNCMYEFYEIFKESKLNPKFVKERILPIRVENIRLNDADVLIEYMEHWQNQKEKWDKLNEKAKGNMGKLAETHKRIQAINLELGDFLHFLADINSDRKEELSKNNFEKIKSAIKQKIEQ